MSFTWDYYYARWFFGAIKRRLFHSYFKHYAEKEKMSDQMGNQMVKNAILEGTPFVASRFGSTELYTMTSREARLNHRYTKCVDTNLCELSGFFPDDKELIDHFCDKMKEIIPEIDLLGSWYLKMEEYFLIKYMPNTKISGLLCVEPYLFRDDPWSSALKGKKVLVIHPFEKSIQKQYLKRKELFGDTDILPEFELLTIKAVQTIAGEKDSRFKNWFEALAYMESEMEKVDFDVAIIGCGAYGMPLAVKAKRMGKVAIHIGGATQLLFGIKGSRWNNNESINCYFNDSWVLPDDSETPKRSKVVENSCYW